MTWVKKERNKDGDEKIETKKEFNPNMWDDLIDKGWEPT